MITETATVVETQGEYAWVATQRNSSCGSCSAGKVCGTAVLDGVVGRKLSRLRVRNPVAAQPGQLVEIGIEDAVLVKGSMLVYLLPLAALMLGAATGQWLAGEGGAIIGAALALAGGYAALRHRLRTVSPDGYDAVIIRSI